MKVMHLIAGGDAGGAKTHLLNLLTRLCREEEVTLICLGDGILAEEAKARGLTVKILTGSFLKLNIVVCIKSVLCRPVCEISSLAEGGNPAANGCQNLTEGKEACNDKSENCHFVLPP